MKLLFTRSKQQYNKILTDVSALSRIQKFNFNNIPEFSESNVDTTNTQTNCNTMIESLSDNKTYQTVLADSSLKRSPKIDTLAWKRQNRKLVPSSKFDNSMYSGIHNAQSIKELHQALETFKNKTDRNIKSIQKTHKQSIMDILDSIAGDNAQSETEQMNVSDKENKNAIIKKQTLNLIGAYEHAIKRCGLLKKFDEGFQIFEELKQINKSMITARVYGAVIWLTIEQDFSEESLNKCFDVYYNEMEDMNLTPTPYVYSELIKAATSLRLFKRAGGLVNKIMKDDELSLKYLQNSKMLRHVIMNYYAKSGKIKTGLKLMKFLTNNFGSSSLDDIMYSTMITGCGLRIKNGDESMMEAAEKLFQQSFNVLERPPKINVFSAFLNCYSYVPDIESCIDLLKSMKEIEDWPNPDAYAFGAALKSATQYFNQPLSYEKGWKYVNEIVDMIGLNDDINKEHWSNDDYCAIYGLLFSLCGGSFCQQSDLGKLYGYYDEMANKGIKLNTLCANSLLMAGVDHYKLELLNNPHNKEEVKKDVVNYIDWALLQFNKYNLNLAKYQNEKLQQKLSVIM